ncbi:MAG: hypothetical protein ACYDER_17955 [Ktedonobacteraceae bacterium]
MYTIMVNTGESTSSAFPMANISIFSPPLFRTIAGALPDGRWLASPLTVVIEYDEEEVVVSEPRFHMHASASTEAEALSSFRRIFSGFLDVLSAREEKLDPYLHEQLAYLRSYIKTE